MGSLSNCFSPLHRTLFPVYTLIFPPRSFAVEKYSFFFFFSLPNLDHLTIEI